MNVPRIVLTWAWFVGGSVVIALATIMAFLPDDSATNSSRSITELPVEQASSSLPAFLIIPAIKVNAAVEHLGLTPDGAMDVPKDPDDTAWFELGPRPGDIGVAVIAGHFGWKNDIPAVFDHLNELRPGNLILVQNEKGETTTFVVRELRRYGENEDSSSVFNSLDGKAHLNLITCEGTWDTVSKSYSNRLVVFADKKI